MVSRCPYGWKIKSEVAIAVHKIGAWPDAFGKEIIKFVKESDMGKFLDNVKNISLINCDDPTAPGKLPNWERKAGIKYLYQIAEGTLHSFLTENDFISDVACEFGYLLNFNTNCIDFYEGHQKTLNPGFFGIKSEEITYFGQNLTLIHYPAKKVGSLSFEEIKLNSLESLYETMMEFYDYDFSQPKYKSFKENHMWVDIVKEDDTINFIINDNIVEVQKSSLFFDPRNILIVNFMPYLSQDFETYCLHMQLVDRVQKLHNTMPKQGWDFQSFIVRPDGIVCLNVLDSVFHFIFRNVVYLNKYDVKYTSQWLDCKIHRYLDKDSAYMSNIIDKRISKFIIDDEVRDFEFYKINMKLAERIEELNNNLDSNEKPYDWISMIITQKNSGLTKFAIDCALKFLLRNLYLHFNKSKFETKAWLKKTLRKYAEKYYITKIKPEIFTERMFWEMGNRKNIIEAGNSNHEIITNKQILALVDAEIEEVKKHFEEMWKKW